VNQQSARKCEAAEECVREEGMRGYKRRRVLACRGEVVQACEVCRKVREAGREGAGRQAGKE